MLLWMLLVACSDVEEEPDLFQFTAIEVEVHDLVNAYRADNGLPALELDGTIGETARTHSKDMLNGSVAFGHDGFDGRADSIDLVLDVSTAAENVAYSSGFDDPAQIVVQGWIDSPGHEENMVGDFALTGVGAAERDGEYYFTQLFVQLF